MGRFLFCEYFLIFLDIVNSFSFFVIVNYFNWMMGFGEFYEEVWEVGFFWFILIGLLLFYYVILLFGLKFL